MNINSTSTQSSIFGLSNQTNTSNKPLVRSVEPVVISTTEQETLLNNKASQGVISDQQAIALFEKYQFEANAESGNRYSATDKDKPPTKNEIAVASYQTVGDLAQRESVQQLFGVDIFA